MHTSPKRLKPLTHIMGAGHRIDLHLASVANVWIAEIDGRMHRLHDFDFVAAPGTLLSVRGSNHADGSPTALHPTHERMLWFHAKWSCDLLWCNVGGKFATPIGWEGTSAWQETRMDLFTADVPALGLSKLWCRNSYGRQLDVKRIVIECATDMSAAPTLEEQLS